MRPQQQSLWQWTPEDQGKRVTCALNHLTAQAQEQAQGDAELLYRRLAPRLGEPMLLWVHNNRKRMLTISNKNGAYHLRLHHMFLSCEPEVQDALVAFVKKEDGARHTLMAYIKAHQDAIDHVMSEQFETSGRFHDLKPMFDRCADILDSMGYTMPQCTIGWGRHGKGRRSIRLGSYDYQAKLIRIHPALDQAWVPAYFVEYVVFHEALHSVIEPIYDKSRRIIHTAEFLRMERQYPTYTQANTWEKANLRRLLQGN